MKCPKCGYEPGAVAQRVYYGATLRVVGCPRCDTRSTLEAWRGFSPPAGPPPAPEAPAPTPTRRPVPHYMSGNMECIDVLRAVLSPEEFRGFLRGNALKYLYRFKVKGGTDDLHKAETYTRWLGDEWGVREDGAK